MTPERSRHGPGWRHLLLLVFLAFGSPARAHETTQSYLQIVRDGPSVSARLSVAFRDLEPLVWLDADLDGTMVWAEVEARAPAIVAAVAPSFRLDSGGACALTVTVEGVARIGGRDHLDLRLRGACPHAAAPLALATTLFADIDPDHRVFVSALSAGRTETFVLPTGGRAVTIDLSGRPAILVVVQSVRTGAAHFAGGIDHALFVLVLLLPVVARAVTVGAITRGVIAPITGFTAGHALALTTVMLGVALPRADIVSVAILFTILLTALDNLWPFLPRSRVLLAAGFGLIHGFGFASALDGLGLDGPALALAILGFNLGVEAAQIAAVLAVLPALRVLDAPGTVLRVGSAGAFFGAAVLLAASPLLFQGGG